MKIVNEMKLEFIGKSEYESFARMVISAFMLPANPTLDQLSDVKTAVSEAVTNAIVHGYSGREGVVRMRAWLHEDGMLSVEIEDEGCGIADINQAMQPFYTSHPELERSGMGFTVMESFMDELSVTSQVGQGTTVRMQKALMPVALYREQGA